VTSRAIRFALGAIAAAIAQTPAVARAQLDGQGAPAATPTPFAIPAPSRKSGATVARIVAPTSARRRLESAKGARRLQPHTSWSGQPQTLLVLDAAAREGRDWVKVLLANRPNGAAAWVARDRVRLSRNRYWIDVRTKARSVVVYRSGKRVRRIRAVVGTSHTPTPYGLAAVYEINRQPDPHAFLGPWVLSLTSHSNVLKSFGGGSGRVGIHGRSGASLDDPLGSARSHGCIRIRNRDISWMAAHIPRGTPVRVRR
jgi:lipoprotein-anchoring transpeptidase ErfK/SrfK